ncbi:glycine cleavage system aminomethyltransferase GcvT [Candidatus Kapabacteria bacterium]|nr:glycine cleavage system aminomethyltransferase GcvT [Candidatus Kapabacteria bacterium]
MKKTNFYDIHEKYQAKLVDYAGFRMPIQYPAGILAEHKIVREACGIFDVTHMGEFFVSGADSLSFIQKITVNDASKLEIGDAQYSAMCYLDGGIVDDLLVYKLTDSDYMLVVNGSNIDKDFDWCKQNSKGFDIELTNQSDDYNLLAVQGPKSLEILNPLSDIDMAEIPFYKFKTGKLLDLDMIISRTGYTGELGFELYFKGDKETALKVLDSLLEAGKENNIALVGLGARDTLRMEKGYALYGNDINETTNPIEAGLGWITKTSKGSFNGFDVIKKVREEKPKRKLVGIVVEADRFIARQGHKIFADGKEIGLITSGNMSPSLNIPIGMGYVSSQYAVPDTRIEIERKGKFFPAIVKKMPLL